jgi:hypothetical protein
MVFLVRALNHNQPWFAPPPTRVNYGAQHCALLLCSRFGGPRNLNPKSALQPWEWSRARGLMRQTRPQTCVVRFLVTME